MLERYFPRISGIIYSGINFLPALLLFSLKLESESLDDISSAVMFAPIIASGTTLKGENVGLIFSRNFQNALLFFNVICAILISIHSINLGSIALLYSLNLLAFYRKDLEYCYTFSSGLSIAIAGVTEIFFLSSLTITALIFLAIVIVSINKSEIAVRINYGLIQELKTNYYYLIQVTVLMSLGLLFLFLLNKALIDLNDLEGYVKSTRLIGIFMAIYGNVFVRSFFVNKGKKLILKDALKLSAGLLLFMFVLNTLLGLVPYNSVLFKESSLWWYVSLDASITILKTVLVPESLKNSKFNLYIYILLFRIPIFFMLDGENLFYGLLVFELTSLIIVFVLNNNKPISSSIKEG